jgi:hypothetical protein
MLSLQVRILPIEGGGSSNDLNDHRPGLLRKPFRDSTRPLLDGTAQLHLDELSGSQRIVERLDERRCDSLRPDVYEGIEMVGFGAKLRALLSTDCHSVIIGSVAKPR